MHLYQFLLLFSFFLYKRAQLVCAWGQNWVYMQGIVYSPRCFKAFIQHIFDCIVCEIFGAWTPYSVPRHVKPVLAYTTPFLCVCLGFLYFSAGLETLTADLSHLCMLAVWHPQCSFLFCVITLLIPNADRQKMGVGYKPFAFQYGLMQAMFLDHQFNTVLKFMCEFCYWDELKFISTSLGKGGIEWLLSEAVTQEKVLLPL